MNQARPRRIAVLGAGITGLAAAYELRRRGGGRQPQPDIVLFEADTRVGGKVRSEKHDGVLYEAGAESFGAAQPQAMELVRELGLGHDVLHSDPRRRLFLVLAGGRLTPLPEGVGQVVPARWLSFLRSGLLTWKGRLRFLGEPFLPAEEGEADESLSAFFGRRLGPEAVARIVEPLLAGACLGDPCRLSVRSLFPHLADMERRGGLLRGCWKSPMRRLAAEADPALAVTLRNGLSTLAEALAKRLPSGCLRLGAPVVRLARRNGGWEVRTPHSNEPFDVVVCALPAPALAQVLEPVDPEVSGVLREIPYSAAAVVTLAYERKALSHPLDAAGLLVPRSEGRRLAGAVFASSRFPGRAPADLAVLRGWVGGEAASGDDAAAARVVRAELREILGLGEAHPRWTRVARWPAAHPQYTIGHALRLRRLESCLQSHPGLILAGESYRGAGLSDCIRSGRLAAAKALTPAGGRAAAGVA
ncbi:MAG: protoporphyrinogen oxidase [Elusimicrobia bacterium]|nr:protoporphyrinogen oxidase [Elusimicrobiota bacterium]